ncbi:uncharacterized protein LOC124607004 isoform X1 [Schistocerca americana]|uniref:uncharacterized protein LOC124607004 isoform X1 n=1 Tax=Schistocerca americana TaxID=7009 RepID=UPI001F4F542B|nr:uncharacterized protein LOC124607004 isoform X1 [Schistocerca americana]
MQIPVKTVAENDSCGKSVSKYKWKTVTYKKKDKCERNPAKQIDKSDFFVIGDSMLKNVVVPNCKVDVRPGIRPQQIVKHFNNIRNTEKSNQNNNDSNTNFKGVIIHVGTNSIRSSRQEEIINDIRNVIRSAKGLFTSSRIVINGILQRRSMTAAGTQDGIHQKHLPILLEAALRRHHGESVAAAIEFLFDNPKVLLSRYIDKKTIRKLLTDIISTTCDQHLLDKASLLATSMGNQRLASATSSRHTTLAHCHTLRHAASRWLRHWIQQRQHNSI